MPTLGARFRLAEGVMFIEQPPEAVEAVRAWLQARPEPLRLSALHLMTSLTGSALLAIAIDAGALGAEEGWDAAHVDEDWQAAQWGHDAEAMARRANRRRDMLAAATLLDAIGMSETGRAGLPDEPSLGLIPRRLLRALLFSLHSRFVIPSVDIDPRRPIREKVSNASCVRPNARLA